MKKITFLIAIAISFSLTTVNAQVHFSDDFSDLNISDWTVYDIDGDGNNWTAESWTGGYLAEFDASLVSRSWTGTAGALSPNNYIVSSAINLTSASPTGLVLEFAYGTIEGAPYHAEHYSVYVTTSNNISAIQFAWGSARQMSASWLRPSRDFTNLS